ncbi:MAG: hypothetical protein B6I38_05410 [Anaerolineaceae bacterium 4572_5.1]|nr:MAG: hypothetical protein B5M51_01845 [Anaerolinea sp. 4484_236]OQY31759.1 MAG: hypothetical protein B6I38_05410 [Anaerolineaceae bacterium 4572_5.1]
MSKLKAKWGNFSKRLTQRWSRIEQLPWGVLLILISLSIASTAWSLSRTGNWEAAALHFGSDMGGAAVIYILLDIVLVTRQKKENLIVQMGSPYRDVAVPAVDELKRMGWLFDGSLKGTRLNQANLERAGLIGAELQDARLLRTNLYGAYLMGANLTGAWLVFANLEEANLTGASLKTANLHGANLTSANLQEANLTGANLKGANLSKANLHQACVSRVDLSGANLTGALLYKTTFNSDTKWPNDFDPIAAEAILVEQEK